MTTDSGRRTFHSRTNRYIALALWLLLAAMAVTTTLGEEPGRLLILPPLGLLAVIAWVLLWRPSLGLGEDGVEVGNPLVRTLIPWNALTHVDTKYSLTLHTPGGKTGVFCAPQPGRIAGGMAARRARADNPRLAASTSVSELPGTESGDAAAAVRQQWQARLDDGRVEAGTAHTTPVRRRLDVTAAVALGGGTVLALIAYLALIPR